MSYIEAQAIIGLVGVVLLFAHAAKLFVYEPATPRLTYAAGQTLVVMAGYFMVIRALIVFTPLGFTVQTASFVTTYGYWMIFLVLVFAYGPRESIQAWKPSS